MADYETHADLAVKRNLTLDKETVLDHLTFKRNDTVLFNETFGPQVGVKGAWRSQGALPEEIDLSAFRYNYCATASLPVCCGRLGSYCKAVSEDDKKVYMIDDMGCKQELYKNVATLPLPVEYPVKTMDDWLKLRPRYEYAPERVAATVEEFAAQNSGKILQFGIPGGFDEPRILMGEENCCLALYEEPEMLEDMFRTFRETALQVIEELYRRNVKIDSLFIHEDMAGKSGPLWGPDTIREWIKPYTLPVWERAQELLGARLFGQDSDGKISPIMEAIAECGINWSLPMEPGAGMDMVAEREKMGSRMAFSGGLDKYMLPEGKDAIDRELEYKVPAMLKTGGVCFGLDHRIVPGSSVENYRYYIRRFWEIAEACMK